VPVGYWSWPAYPAAGLKTTALELARFLGALIGFGELGVVRILDSATVELMITPQFAAAPEFGLGWWKDVCGGREVWGHHGGPGLGTTAEMWWCRAETSGAVVLTNVEYGTSRSAQMTIADALLDYVHTPGIEERANGRSPVTAVPTIVRGVLFLPERASSGASISCLLDVSGQKVMDLRPGANDVRALAPGIYFVRSELSAAGVQKTVLAK